jgi:ubiquinone/menaquinone biosynthesis C-methylase UbiE
VRWPSLWPLFRPLIRWQFEQLAPVWNRTVNPDGDRVFAAALAQIPEATQVLDVGTGTGRGARAVVERFPSAEVTGIDVSPAMVEQARRNVERASFQVGDAARPPFPDGSFDLVTHVNMIPFLDQVARLLRPGGWTVFTWTNGAGTPIYVRPELMRRELERRGFADFAEIGEGRGTAVLARRGDRH